MTRKHICAFVLHRKAKDDPARLVCRVKWDGSRSIVEMNVGFVVDPDRWDASEQRCKRGSFHGRKKIPASTINREIERFENAAEECFADIEQWPSVEQVRGRMRFALGIDKCESMSVQQAIAEFRAENIALNGWSAGTAEKFTFLCNQLMQWREGLTFDDFTTKGLTDFVVWLQTELRLQNTTVLKKVGYLRWFLKWAKGKGYLLVLDYEDFHPSLKTPQNRVVFLTWDELMQLWQWVPPQKEPWLGRVRDIFCFQAFTSLRYSDVMNLQWSDVFPDSLFVITEKTDAPLEIDLNKWSRAILDKYREDASSGPVFEQISNQVMNRALKRVMQMVGFDGPVRKTIFDKDGRREEVRPKYECIGTHTARRTFICNALIMGIPPQVVMKWTGHADYSAMKPYIDVADSERRKAMSAFDKK